MHAPEHPQILQCMAAIHLICIKKPSPGISKAQMTSAALGIGVVIKSKGAVCRRCVSKCEIVILLTHAMYVRMECFEDMSGKYTM